MTAKDIARELAPYRGALTSLICQYVEAHKAHKDEEADALLGSIIDTTDDMRSEAFRLAEKDWMPRPHRTYLAACRLLKIEPY